jgi:hypothetical protein
MPEVTIPIDGRVEGEITIVGDREYYHPSDHTVAFQLVPRAEGKSCVLSLKVSGKHREDVKFSVEEVEPSFLKVELGKPQKIGGVVSTPLKISVPPQSPLSNYMTTPGHVVLATTHPEISRLKLLVSFAIENQRSILDK